MASVGRMVAKRLYGILSAMKSPVSNGYVEMLNSKIRLLRIKFRLFKSKERLKIGVMFDYAKLNTRF
ncbi:hypothetical protein SODG_000704 [Sodalis praecaptivus]|nr:hypothetical protein NVIRENTERO_01978 [Sodalis praecaptivus]